MKTTSDDVLQWPSGRLDFSAGCLIMGVLNVTPDSFSDGGQFLDVSQAVAHGLEMASQGAAIIDIGGESTRPGAAVIPAGEQIRRVVPVIEGLTDQIDVPISIDTCHVEVARAALTAGGKVIGIMPKALVDQEIACVSEIELRVVNDMHERKAAMADLSDGFIAMPGGFGTFEEFFEVLTWQQLGIHAKPCGLLNIQGYYDGLLSFIDHAVEEMFIHHSNKDLILASKDSAQLIEQFLEFQPVKMNKARWVREMADNQSTD